MSHAAQHPAVHAFVRFAQRRRTFIAWIGPLVLWAFGHSTPVSVLVGLPLVLAGQALRLWSAGCIQKNETVATGGPYAYVRNPLYLGSLVLCLGFAVMASRSWGYLVVAAQFIGFYYPAILSEEEYLRATLGEPYARYVATVPRFLPSFRRRTESRASFSWSQVARNKEWRSYVPVLVLTLLFALQAGGICIGLATACGGVGE